MLNGFKSHALSTQRRRAACGQGYPVLDRRLVRADAVLVLSLLMVWIGRAINFASICPGGVAGSRFGAGPLPARGKSMMSYCTPGVF
jgi:hypothetical protein